MANSFEESVNEVVGKMVQSEDGTWELPKDIEVAPEIQFAAGIEKRRRDTQSAYTKINQEKIALENERDTWLSKAEEKAVKEFTPEQQTTLEELKHSDPEAWRNKFNEFEGENKSRFAEARETVSTQARQMSEKAHREALLNDWVKANPELELNDETIEDNIPPKYVKQLEKGEITFEAFLDTAKKFLSKGKTLAPGAEPTKSVDLGKAGGGSVPGEAAQAKELSSTYSEDIY